MLSLHRNSKRKVQANFSERNVDIYISYISAIRFGVRREEN